MSILFGFTKYILELIEKEKPTHLAIAFDPPGGTFRHEMYPEYKATRQKTPEDLHTQIPWIDETKHPYRNEWTSRTILKDWGWKEHLGGEERGKD